MAIMIETDEEKAKQEYDQKMLETETEYILLQYKYGILKCLKS